MSGLLDLASVVEGAYLAIFLLGSVSLGYLVLRLSYPEIRVFESNLKAGYSLIVGWVLVLGGLGMDYAISFYNQGAYNGGIFPLALLLCCLVGFVASRLLVLLRMPNAIQLGLPVRHPTNTAAQANSPPETVADGDKAAGSIGKQFTDIMAAISQSKEWKQQ